MIRVNGDCIYIVIIFFSNVLLTNRDKVIIGYTAVMDFMNELDKNQKIKGAYKSTMFGRLFYLLQVHYFPTMNPKEVQRFIEDANILRRDMKDQLSATIIAASKVVAGGFGIDKPLGQKDDILMESTNNIDIDENAIIDQIIQFHIDAIKQFSREEAINLVTNQALKLVGIKDRPRDEIEKLVITRMEKMRDA